MAIRQADLPLTSSSATPLPNAVAPARPASFGTSKGVRTGDEQVGRWLGEYVRRRDASQRNTDEDAASSGRRSDRESLSELRSRLAHHHTPLVESIARRFLNTGEPFEDLVQEGFLGLLSALEHFDTNKGVKFTTYATHFVAGAIRHCLRDRGKIIKEPAWLHELSGKINRTSDSLTQSLGRPPHAGEIAQVLNLTEEAVEEILSTRQVFQVTAFAAASDDDSDSMAGLVDPEKIRSDKYVTLQLPIEDRIVLEAASLKLKELEQKVLFEFFYKDHNQTEIAKQMGISCNYVSHILKNSTKKLRKIMGEAEVRDRGRTRESSIVDPATGLFTQSHILARAEEEVSRAARSGQKAALLVVAVDGIPRLAGVKRDEAWEVCGEAVRRSVRRMDLAGRFEGESLLVVLPETGAQARVVADRLTDVLMATGAAHHARFTARVGVALYPDDARSTRELLTLAREEAGIAAESGLPVPTTPPEQVEEIILRAA